MTDSPIPLMNIHTSEFHTFGDQGWQAALLYQSEDGRRVVGSFKESGTLKMVMPFDEMIFLVAGSSHITVAGVGEIHMTPGDACYLKQGWDVTFEHSDDFQDITVLISDDPIELEL